MSLPLPNGHGSALDLHQSSPTTPPPELPPCESGDSDVTPTQKPDLQQSSSDPARISQLHEACSEQGEQPQPGQSGESERLRREAVLYNSRPLPDTPESPVPILPGTEGSNRSQTHEAMAPNDQSLAHSQGTSESESVKPTSTSSKQICGQTLHSRVDRGTDANVTPTASSAKPSIDPQNSAKQLSCALRLAKSNMLTINQPEQSAWKRTAYIPGPARLHKHRSEEEPLSPLELARFSFHIDFAPRPFDLFEKDLDSGWSTRTQKLEDSSMSDILDFVETFSFEPASFAGDDFWLDPETRMKRAALSPNRPSHPPGSPGSPLLSPSFRRLSSTSGPRASGGRRRSYQDPYQPTITRSSWNSSPLTDRSPASARRVSLSPLTAKYSSSKHAVLEERERKAALRKMGSPPSSGKGNKIGFMRLLKGAGSIV